MTEAYLTDKIKKALRTKCGGRWIMIHGSGYQETGISDIIGCYRGVFYAIEVKLPGKEKTLTLLQKDFIYDIRKTGGRACMVTSVEEAISFVTES